VPKEEKELELLPDISPGEAPRIWECLWKVMSSWMEQTPRTVQLNCWKFQT